MSFTWLLIFYNLLFYKSNTNNLKNFNFFSPNYLLTKKAQKMDRKHRIKRLNHTDNP